MGSSSLFFSLEQMLNALGVVTILWLSLKAAWSLIWAVRTYLLSELWTGVDLASYGPWAVVTGATAGIGKAYAHELARRGLNVVLISRSVEKLKQVATDIGKNPPEESHWGFAGTTNPLAFHFRENSSAGKWFAPLQLNEEKYGRSTKVIQADFTHGSELYKPIQAALQGLEIGILVNNVGQTKPTPHFFLDDDNLDKFISDMVNCNILSTTKMTQIVLPQMVARKKGIVINMSSATAEAPVPFLLIYSSTKVFDDFFSQGLDKEYRSKGIIVQSIIPLFVESNLTTHIKNIFKISAKAFARQALNTVGITNRTPGCFFHHIQGYALKVIMPAWLSTAVVARKTIQSFMLLTREQEARLVGEEGCPRPNGNQQDQRTKNGRTRD